MRIKSKIPAGRPTAEVDRLAEIVKQKYALKDLEKEYKSLVDILKAKNKPVISGCNNILYFKEVERSKVDVSLFSETERLAYERLIAKATVKSRSLSFDKIIAK